MSALQEKQGVRDANALVQADDDLVAFIADCLDLAVECGCADSIRTYLNDDRWRPDVEQELADEGSPLRTRIISAKKALARMEAIEAVHGIGAALVVNHPFNIQLAAYGLRDLSRAELLRSKPKFTSA